MNRPEQESTPPYQNQETSPPEKSTKRGGKRPRAGRKSAKIDLAELQKLCALPCTDAEIAAFFEVSVRTIERRKKNPAFAQRMERGRNKGKASLRRNLWSLAMKENVAANIFLAKNLLGYKDYFSNEHSGPDGGPIPLSTIEVLHQRRNRLAQERKARNTTRVPTEPPVSHSEGKTDVQES